MTVIVMSIGKMKDEARTHAHRQGHQLCGFISNGREPESFLAGCNKCGMRVVVQPEETAYIEGEATIRKCDGDSLRALETKAWLLGESALLLEKRLEREMAALAESWQDRFYPGEFQPEWKRWVSDDGMVAVQWKLRNDPESPIDEDNPQSLLGVVEFVTLIGDEQLRPGLYIGPRLNPNGTEDEEEWWCIPLETDETGFGYQDDCGNWRFKRPDGTTGFYVEEQHIEFD